VNISALQGHILTPQGFVRGELQIHQGRIATITGTLVDEAAVRTATCPSCCLDSWTCMCTAAAATTP
jgi:DTW domain-containing protein YfiP